MSGRSHRHRVPTARPPAQATGIVYLWGRGAIGSDLRMYLHDEHASIAEHDDVARKLATDHGCPIDIVRDAWAWRLESVSAAIIDQITRRDPHVLGWTQFQRETCPPSVALRNALNALNEEEAADAAALLAERFGKAEGAQHTGGPNWWVARDNRLVVFDPQTQRWRLGEYFGA